MRSDRDQHAPSGLVSAAVLEQVRERARIIDLFPASALRRAGREFLTCCPWHEDRRPSLTVSPKRNRVHCFVCGKGTDAIGWLQDREGLSFQEAVLELARRTGVTVVADDPEAQRRFEQEWRERRQRLAQRSEQRARFQEALEQQLQEADGAGEAAAYLQSRGISVDSARQWQLGTAGGRLMIPLQDPAGQVVGFCGRAMGQQQPKYRNSAGDLLFQRNAIVFGLDQAAETIRREGVALLVEGPLDVIQLHQAGFRNAVACLGTSVSALQLQLLRRHGLKQLLIAFDGDKAGQAATQKLLEQLMPQLVTAGLSASVVQLPDGEDADGLIRCQGIAALEARIAAARHWLDWRLDNLLAPVSLGVAAAPLDALQALEAAGQALLKQLPEGVLRRAAEQRLDQLLQQGDDVPVAQATPLLQRPVASAGGGVWPLRCPRQRAECRVLRLFIHAPDCRPLLQCLQLRDPTCRMSLEWLSHLAPLCAEGSLAAMSERLAQQLPGAVGSLLLEAASAPPELVALLQRDAQAELEALLDALEPVE